MTSQTYNSVLSAVQGAMQEPPIDASRQPVVLQRDGEVMADSRDVAAFFGKRHTEVLRAIYNLSCSSGFKERNFASFKINDLTGESTSHVLMTKDGFTFLAMGFTGEKAARFKEAYIGQFNVMESELRRRSSAPMVPQSLSEALRLAADQAEEIERQSREIKTLAPKAAAHDRIADAQGSLCVTDTAKTLQINPQVLFKWLRMNGWIYKRVGSTEDVAYQSKIQAGFLEHKATPVTRRDGTEKVVTRVRVTPKGLAKLAEVFNVSPSSDEVH